MEKRKIKPGLKNEVLSRKKPKNFTRTINPPKVKKPSLLVAESNKEWNSGDPFELGVAYLKNKDYVHTIISLKENLELDPECKSSRYGLGVAYLELEKFEEAISEFKQLLLREPSNLEAR